MKPQKKSKVKSQESRVIALRPLTICFLVFGYLWTSCVRAPEIEKKTEAQKPEISSAQKHYSFGCEYLKNRMYDDAIKNFELAIEESTAYVDAYIGLGSAYRGKNEFGETELVYEKMIKIAPLKGHYALGKLYTDLGKYESALSEYREILRIDSSYADAWYGMGYVYENIDSLPGAIENYKQALNESVRYSLAKTYVLHGEYEEGIKELKDLKSTHPEDLDVRRELGCAYLGLKRYNEAREEFTYITQRSPRDIANRIKLGIACEGLKDYKSAIQAYEEAISIDTTNIVSYCYLTNLYIELGNLAKASQLLEAAKRINPDSQLLHYISGTIWVKKGDDSFKQKNYDSSISSYNSAISEYELALKGEDQELVSDAKEAIKSAESKLKRAKDEKWWH